MKNKDWKNKISHHAPEVNEHFWEDIEQQLPKKQPNRAVVPLLLLGLLLLSLLSIVVYNESSVTNDKNAAIATTRTNSEDSTIEIEQKALHQTKKAQKKAARTASDLEDNGTIKFDQTKPAAIAEKNTIDSKMSENSKSESLNTNSSIDNGSAPFSNPTKSIELTFNQLKSRGIAAVQLPMLHRTPVAVIIVKTAEEAKKSDKDKVINFYFNTSLFSAYHKINPNLLDDKVIKYIDNPAFSWDRLGYKLSAGVNKDLSEKLNIYLGISYLQQAQTIKYGYEITTNTSLMIDALQQNTIQITPNKEIQEEVIQVKNQSIGLHTGLAYTLVRRANYSQAIDIQVDWQHQIGDKAFYGPDQFYINLAYNNLYQLNQWLSFKVSPVISYTVNEFAGQSDNSLSLKPYSLGLDFGLTIHLRH